MNDAMNDGGFSDAQYAALADAEARHFWFRARRRLILAQVRRYCPGMGDYLDVGCGSGALLAAVGDAFPAARLSGLELSPAGLARARARMPDASLVAMDARAMPWRAVFDAIGAYDSIEHIADDRAVLRAMHAALRPGGILLLTVPQHMWLWSPVDRYAGHQRRYTARNLHAKLNAAGFDVVRSTSFVSLLLPAVLLSRRRGQGGEVDPLAEFRISPALNTALGWVMTVEGWLIRCGINLPIGTSRLVVARKL